MTQVVGSSGPIADGAYFLTYAIGLATVGGNSSEILMHNAQYLPVCAIY